jgi:DNA-binding MarR family transcriptional regulator
MAPAAGIHGAISMSANLVIDKKLIPQEILKDSLILHLASAYFSIGKRLEQKTGCSQTRGFILSTLRGGASLNQNQIATMLGFDRTSVHRAVKIMIQEGLLSERKTEKGRSLLLQLTAKGNKYREGLIKERRALDDIIREHFSPEDLSAFLHLLKRLAELQLT